MVARLGGLEIKVRLGQLKKVFFKVVGEMPSWRNGKLMKVLSTFVYDRFVPSN
jgi:hypothetical protein